MRRLSLASDAGSTSSSSESNSTSTNATNLDYLGRLARQNVRKLLDAYRVLAPVCIGGPPKDNSKEQPNASQRIPVSKFFKVSDKLYYYPRLRPSEWIG